MIKNAPTFDAEVLKCGTPIRVTYENGKIVDGLIREQAPHFIKVRSVGFDGRDSVDWVSIDQVQSGAVTLEFLYPATEVIDLDQPMVPEIHPANVHTLTSGQWAALQGHITKWRKAARFWEAEAKQLGSDATYKIRERRRAPHDGSET